MIWCVACAEMVEPRLTTGQEVYSHRPDLSEKPYWRCDTCSNWVGCHRGTITPLGCIPTPELKAWRTKIHSVLDPLWQGHWTSRSAIYARLSSVLGREYHTAELRSLGEASMVYQALQNIQHESMRA